RYRETAGCAETAIEASGTDYNVYVPITNALDSLGKKEQIAQMGQREIQALEGHIRPGPQDARARLLLAADYAATGRTEEAMREANLGVTLRPNEATVLYNAACVFCQLGRKAEGMAALKKAGAAGFSVPARV